MNKHADKKNHPIKSRSGYDLRLNVKNQFFQLTRNPLISGSVVIFSGTLLLNVLNFFFNLYMSNTDRLTPADYGTISSLISLFTLVSMPAASITPTIVNFAARYFAKGELALVRGLFLRLINIFAFIGFCILLIFFIFSSQIGQFLQITNYNAIFLIGIMTLISYLAVITNSLLQAKLDFLFSTVNTLVGTAVKLLLGILLVYLGFSVTGAVLAIVIASVIPYIGTLFRLRFLFYRHIGKIHISMIKLFSYGIPASLSLLFLTSFISTDIILVKHFFDPTEAGIYAVLSLVGRVIFFLTAPINSIMFPVIVQKYTKGENFHNDFRLSLILVAIPSALLTLFYFTFPEFSIEFFNKKVVNLRGAPYLGLFGLFITIYALINIITNFYLSINKTKVFIPIIIAAVLQICLIWVFHNSFLEVILSSLGSAVLLLMMLLIYYVRSLH